jgi:cysteine desulfurase / selenocysteine lyase
LPEEETVALIDKREFVGLEEVAHLCTGGEAPWLRSHTAACERFGALKSAGMAGRKEMFAIAERARARAARLLGVATAEVERFFEALDRVGARPGQAVAAG